MTTKRLKEDHKLQQKELKHLMWYHGKTNRNLAVSKLKKGHTANGDYLVRASAAKLGDFVLSFIHDKVAHHYQIQETADLTYRLDVGPELEGLDEVIKHYTIEAHGLPCKLLKPCPGGKYPPPLCIKHGYTNLLHKAVESENVPLALQMIKDSACPDLNDRDNNGSTVLHLACVHGLEDVVCSMLDKTLTVEAVDSDGYTPLQRACMNNHAKIVQVLTEKGKARPDYRHHRTGNMALHEATLRGNMATVKMLLSLNVPCWPRNATKKTPYELAVKYSHNACAKLIDDYPLPETNTTMDDWFHPNLDRKGAVALLEKNKYKDGLFLVRESSHSEVKYVLTLAYEGRCLNYKIESHKDQAYFTSSGPLWKTLPHLIQYYCRDVQGMECPLSTAIKPDGTLKPMTLTSGRLKNPAASASVPPRPSSAAPPARPGAHPPAPGPPPPSARGPDALGPPPSAPPPPPLNRIISPVGKKPASLEPKSIEQGEELGQGEYGSVLRGRWTSPDGIVVPIAIKTLNEAHMGNGKENFLKEADIMVRFDHQCIVKLIGVCEGPPIMLVQELVPLGSLLDYLLDYCGVIQVDRDIPLWAAQVASGMIYLEKQGFVHRDLATRNILLATKFQVKVGDFGLSRAVGSESDYYRATQGGRWPVKWYAPESINYGTFSHASDVWSYGVTLWEMYTFGDQPYDNMTGAEVVDLLERNGRLEMPENTPEAVYKLMLGCWSYEPPDRPSFKHLYNFFSSRSSYVNAQLEGERFKLATAKPSMEIYSGGEAP